MSENIKNKYLVATKWSTLTELLSKLVTPLSSMVLARILAPEVFGIVASINTIISFCDVFADAGFQKYVIQHEVTQKDELNKVSNVAFWTNMVISLLLWGLVIVFAKPLAKLVGCEGKGMAVIAAGMNLPLHAITSIQEARIKREMNFKMLFRVRSVTIFTPFIVTIPCALVLRSYWALIIGTIAGNALRGVTMMIMQRWHPSLYYNKGLLKLMISFSIWSMLEALLVWVINWGDTFIVSNVLDEHYFGLYKTSMSMVNQIIAVISGSIVPVLLTALARQQGDMVSFRKTFYQFGFYTGLLLIPLGVGIYIYREAACIILLGSAWLEGATLMGTWGLISAFAIIFNSFCGNALIAKGKPKVSVWIQLGQIVVLIPAVYYSALQGFESLSYTRSYIRIFGMILYGIAVKMMFNISMVSMVYKLIPGIIATVVMAVCGTWFVSLDRGIGFEIFTVFICVIIYAGALICFPSVRSTIKDFMNSNSSVLQIIRKRKN